MTVFSLHISTTLHLTIFGIWGNNIQSVQCVICVMIVRGLWYIGLVIRYTIMLRIYVHHGAPFCVLTVKRHCLPLTRLPRVAGGAPAVNHKATAIWLALRILAGNEHCNVCDGNMVSEYIFNFFMATFIHSSAFHIHSIRLPIHSIHIFHSVAHCPVSNISPADQLTSLQDFSPSPGPRRLDQPSTQPRTHTGRCQPEFYAPRQPALT